MTSGRWRDRLSLGGLRRRLGRGTSTQLVAVMAVVAALALTWSLYVTGAAVRTDQREQATREAERRYRPEPEPSSRSVLPELNTLGERLRFIFGGKAA